jgi:hypothetical protein
MNPQNPRMMGLSDAPTMILAAMNQQLRYGLTAGWT